VKHYHDFLAIIDRIENNPVFPSRSVIIGRIKRRLDILTLSLGYQKLKLSSIFNSDFVEDDDHLYEFFGSRDLKELESKLDQFIKRLEEVSSRN
jgi:hypothetical protein